MKSSPPKTRTRLGWGGRAVLFILFTGVWLAAQKDLLLDRARQALDKDDTTQAIALLENYRRAHATDAEVCNLLGIAYGREGKNEQSLAMFKEFARLAPNTPGAYNNLGTAYLRHQDSEYAEAAFRHEHSSAIGYEAAVAAAGVGDRKAAIRILGSIEPPGDQSVVPWLKLVGS